MKFTVTQVSEDERQQALNDGATKGEAWQIAGKKAEEAQKAYVPMVPALELEIAEKRIGELEGQLEAANAKLADPEYQYAGSRIHRESIIARNQELDELRDKLKRAEARTFEHAIASIADALMLRTEAELKKLLGPEFEAAVARAEKAEVEKEEIEKACQNLVDAVARARKADDNVDREPEDENFHEQEEAHVSLIIFENAALAALKGGATIAPARAITKILTSQDGRPFVAYLSDGMKIGIEREGGAAWLRIEQTPLVMAALTPETPAEQESEANNAL